MAHLQYLPGDPRLVDQLVYELKSKGIFDQFRKDCIADVDTRPAYQNLRQRVESSVSTFLSRQCWQPDLNKNQLREKLRKHILDGNYLEQGVERIVDQVVNPKVASVFVPQVEDLVYNYLGITRKKTVTSTTAEASNEKTEDLLPTDLEAVSPGSVKSNDGKNEPMDTDVDNVPEASSGKMEVDEEKPKEEKVDVTASPAPEINHVDKEKPEGQEITVPGVSELTPKDSVSVDNSLIPLPADDIKPERIPTPESSPPKVELEKIELPMENNSTKAGEVERIDTPQDSNLAKVEEVEKIEEPKEMNCSMDIPLPADVPKDEKDNYFKPINSDDDESSSDSSLRRNMSPLTPIRNFNNENSCDAQQAFDNDSLEGKSDARKEPSSFRFAIEAKSTEVAAEAAKAPKKPADQLNLAYQFNSQVKINAFNTPTYEESSNSNNLHIDYESDANSKVNSEQKAEAENSEDSKKTRKPEEKKSAHKSSHRSRDAHKHSSSKDRRSESKHSTSRDSGRHDRKSTKDDQAKSKSSYKESSRDRSDKKDSKESSRHSSSHKSSSHKDSKSHKSSSSSNRHSSKSDDKRSSSSSHHKSDKSSDRSTKDKPRESKSSSQRSDRDKKSSKSKHDDKGKEKKEKKESDDHYSLSGRGNPNRRSTDRDSNDGSSSSKGFHNQPSSKSVDGKKDAKTGSTKSDNMSTGSETTSPSDRELTLQEKEKEVIDMLQPKPVIRLETHLETPITSPPRVPFVPEVTIKKPKFAANLEEARKLMKMRKFLDDEQKRMNQEAALLLEFQANVRPSLSQVYSSIPGPELEFACVTNNNVHSQVALKGNDALQCYAEDEGFSDNIEDDVPSTLTVREVEESIESINEELNNKAKAHATEDLISKDTYESTDKGNSLLEPEHSTVNDNKVEGQAMESQKVETPELKTGDNNKRTEFFEVTIITEELSESEESLSKRNQKRGIKMTTKKENVTSRDVHPEQSDFRYFGEHEKYIAELESDRFSRFFKAYVDPAHKSKVHLINCDPYQVKIVREALEDLGHFEVVNYQRNGHVKLPKMSRNIVKNVNLSSEVSLPCDSDQTQEFEVKKPVTEAVFSPVKSDCSFELSSDYDARLEEMVNKTSRQEIMEIILGNVTADSPTKMPRIDYFTDSNIESEVDSGLKRKLNEVETVNNNRHVLTPNKMRRLSASDQISSTTEDLDTGSNNNLVSNTARSKYLGRAKRVGLPRPRKADLPNSPSSDKSVENYEQNTPAAPQPPNGKIKTTPRNKVQRYDTSDLYKPKLHYLSRRNNIS
ncbi:unnamed protein product, partial [Iphiclides podalirius]